MFILYKSNTRGISKNSWLTSFHTFSFNNYYDSNRMNFGLLRVFNDDIVAADKGFGMHPHDNMEIISIVLEGSLRHEDNFGNKRILNAGDVQVMSAGTGVVHSEYNNEKSKTSKFLQIWIEPKIPNIKPRYDQKHFDIKENQLIEIVGNNNDSLKINQETKLFIGKYISGKKLQHNILKGFAAFIFVISGEIRVNEHFLETRDAIGIDENIEITFNNTSEILLIEVPVE